MIWLYYVFDYLRDNPWLFFFFFILILDAWLAWRNRTAEKVLSAIVGGVAAGFPVAIITSPSEDPSNIWLRLSIIASSVLLTIYFIALKGETKRVEFPTVFVYESDSKRPLEELNRTYEYYFCQRTVPCPPGFIISRLENTSGANGTGGELYFDLLLRSIVDLLCGIYRNAWDMKVIRRFMYASKSISMHSHEGAPSPDFISRDEFQRLFPESRTLKVAIFPGGGERLAVPSCTRLLGMTELDSERYPYKRTLVLKNSFVEVTIVWAFSNFTRAGLGDLGLLLGFDEEERNKFSTYKCEFILTAKFKRLKSGHPEMQRFRRWVDVMFEELQENFDSKRLWERGKEWYILKKLSAIKENS